MATDSDKLRDRLERATAHLDPPYAVVDLSAFDANAEALVNRAAGKPVRVASKSVRVRDLLTRVLDRPGWRGVMAFTLPEALWLARTGVSDDVLVAYPTADRNALAELAADPALAAAVTLMVDDAAQLDLVDQVCPPGRRPPLRVCLDLDASWRPIGGRVHVGVRRSPVHSAGAAGAFAAAVAGRPGFRLVGLMSYEAQIAGLGDAPPGQAVLGTAIRVAQRGSYRELLARRAAAVAAVREHADLEFVNGGGTGSVAATSADPAVTEVTAGSGLYGPTLFDAYRAWRPTPAAFFACAVVRRPGPGLATVLGGGWIASRQIGR
ncbi:alanine racemase, partial [Micromonospora sp. NPDC003776]